MISVNPEFVTILVGCLNQSRVSALLQSYLMAAIKFGTAEAQRLNWAFLMFLVTAFACSAWHVEMP